MQLIAVAAAGFFFVEALVLTRRGRLRDGLAFLWLTLSLAGLVGALALPLLDRLATDLGVHYMPSLVLLVACVVTLSLLLYATVVLSRHEEALKRLAQEVAFLEEAQRAERESRSRDEDAASRDEAQPRAEVGRVPERR